jgi:hypothetical protein
MVKIFAGTVLIGTFNSSEECLMAMFKQVSGLKLTFRNALELCSRLNMDV